MEDYQKRVIIERAPLQIKVNQIENFIQSDKFKTLTSTDQALLLAQSIAMQEYLDILTKRIDLFKK